MQSILETERLRLYPSSPRLTAAVTDYFLCNRAFLRPFEPWREEAFFTLAGQRRMLREDRRAAARGSQYRFWFTLREAPRRVVGSVALTHVLRGSARFGCLAYRADAELQGRGYTTEAADALLDFAFGPLGLHRAELSVMPRNKPSLRVAEKLGFTREGFSPAYLNINGVWEDHVRLGLVNPKG
jgi:ribosomal-protein-alanine N-acetyltransferase